MITVELQEQVYQETLNDMLYGSSQPVIGTFKGVPTGNFTRLTSSMTQFTVNETAFRITTTNIGEKHTIRATLISLDNNTSVGRKYRVVERVFIPKNAVTVVSIPLRKGDSQIEVFTSNDGAFTAVNSSYVGTFITAYARELFNSTQNLLDEQTRALFSRFSSRITEILIPFQDLYPNPKSLRTLISRFVTRAYMTKNGSTQGVRDFTAALLGTTPIFVPCKTDENVFAPNVVPVFRRQLEFAGFEAHTWIPNYEISHWLAFIKLLDSARHYYKIQEIGESEVLVEAGGVPEIHRFDFDDPDSTAYSEFNFTDFRVVVEIFTSLTIRFCAAGYPFDLFISELNPLGQKRITFDSPIPFDSGEGLDAPYLDPGDDGWIGFTLSGRFDQYALNSNPIILALDSLFITPAVGSGLEECVYDGFFTQQLSLLSQSVNVPFAAESSGVYTDVPVTVDEFKVDSDVVNFSNIGDFSLTGAPGSSIVANPIIALAGTSSVQFLKTTSGANPVVTWTNPGAPLNLSSVGAETAYLTVYLGRDTLTIPDTGVPRHPGKLASITTKFIDGSGNFAGYTWHKEDLDLGKNTLPLLLDFPDGPVSSAPLDRTDIVSIEFALTPVNPADTWEGLYIGRMHVLNTQANFRPSRAKIELEDVDNVFPQSLYGGKLTFTSPDGDVLEVIGNPTYNNLDENAYVPNLYKVQLTAGVGTEGFDREATAENIRLELGRQGDFLKTSVVNKLPYEIYLDVFSKQFSQIGSQNTLSFTPDPGNPVTPDLMDVTSFAGGLAGNNSRIGGGTGTIAIAQSFNAPSGATLKYIELLLHRLGQPGGSLNVTVHANNPVDSAPGLVLGAAVDKFAVKVHEGVPGYEIFGFREDVVLSASADPYWIVVSGNGTYEADNDVNNHIVWSKSSVGSALVSATTDGIFTLGSFWTLTPGTNHFFKVLGV